MHLVTDETLAAWVALSLVPHLGGSTLLRLVEQVGGPEAALAADEETLRAVRGIGPRLAASICAAELAATRDALARWRADGVTVLVRPDCAAPSLTTAYPPALAAHPDAPIILFRRGMSPPPVPAVAIVGTRQPSDNARRLAWGLGRGMATQGWLVVSGLAEGIDAAAHQGALAYTGANGGATLAVLGSGVSRIYPSQHRALAAQVAASGGLLSEAAPSANPTGPALVARNRLITALAHVVVVVEAGENSGALHAARFATQQGTPVYTMDWDAAGNQALLAQGARQLPDRLHAACEVLAQITE